MTSKSGGNRFTGSAFGIRAATRISPRAIRSAISTAATIRNYRQSQFGANLGGPVLKNRTFFFGSYDGWRFQDIAAIAPHGPVGQ